MVPGVARRSLEGNFHQIPLHCSWLISPNFSLWVAVPFAFSEIGCPSTVWVLCTERAQWNAGLLLVDSKRYCHPAYINTQLHLKAKAILQSIEKARKSNIIQGHVSAWTSAEESFICKIMTHTTLTRLFALKQWSLALALYALWSSCFHKTNSDS